MKTRRTWTLHPVVRASLLRFGLLAVLLTSCAPQAATETSSAQPSATLLVDVPSPTTEAIPTESVVPTALPVATSRGPDLHATDPLTVSLASGQLQLVEFFRFT